MPTLPTIADYMDTTVHTLAPDTDIVVAVKFLLDRRVTGAPVISAEGKLVGMVTEYDCLNLLAGGNQADPPKGTVADYMTREVVSIPPTMNIYFCAGLFLGKHFRRLPVVKDGRLVGAITRFDILRAIRANLQ